MADERALWAARGIEIIARPGDDDLRYDFAAELEQAENAESPNRARAEFIRVQLRLSQLPPSHPGLMRLATHAYFFELRYREMWIPAWIKDLRVREVEFHRGFVELVKVPARLLIEAQSLNRLFAEAPIQHLDVVELKSADQLKPLLESLGKNGHLEKLVSLRLDGQDLGDESVELLENAPFRRLRWLSLAHNRIGENGFNVLVSGGLRRLRFVDLHDNPYDPTTYLAYDQGVVIERREDPRSSKLEEIPWLRKTVRAGQYIQPDRFRTL